MADDRELAEATAPLSFAEFLDRMKDPAAADLVRSIKNFIKTFEERKSDPDTDSHLVQQFLAKSEGAFRQHPVWASGPPEHQAQAIEGLEKYLMTKIYHKAFAVATIDRERDEALSLRMAALNFIMPAHLDIPSCFQDEKAWLLAMKELHKINSYKAPRDKLVCILNCCRIINNLLHLNVGQGEARGADDFLPILIYIVIHANPPQLCSNLEYIQRFRMQSRMVSESSYFFTQLYSAASFIETISSNSLTMDADEFVARMVAAGIPDMQFLPEEHSNVAPPAQLPRLEAFRASSPEPSAAEQMAKSLGGVAPEEKIGARVAINAANLIRQNAQTGMSAPETRPDQPGNAAITADYENAGIRHVLAAEAIGDLHARHPYIYASAEDLCIGDVELVLSAYKQMVLRYEALSLGLLHSTARNSLPLSDVADPTPAIDGPNPFAADKPDRKPSSNKLGPSNVHKPFNPKGPVPAQAAKPVRIAESDPFPSLAASHRLSMSMVSSMTTGRPAQAPDTEQPRPASLSMPIPAPVPQPSLAPLDGQEPASTAAAAAAIESATSALPSANAQQPAGAQSERTLRQRSQLLSLLDQQAVQSPTELGAQLPDSLHTAHEIPAGTGNTTAMRAPSTREVHLQDPPAISPFEQTAPSLEELGVVFPQCSVSSLFGDRPREGSGKIKPSGDPCQEAIQDSVTLPNPGVSSPFQEAQPEDNLSVTFQRPLQSPFDTGINSQGIGDTQFASNEPEAEKAGAEALTHEHSKSDKVYSNSPFAASAHNHLLSEHSSLDTESAHPILQEERKPESLL